MQIQRSVISEDGKQATIELLIADHADPAQATEHLLLHVKVPSDQNPLLLALLRVALLRARTLINEQLQETSTRSNIWS